jgi:DNA-binding NarL/FixJ family response regulator
VPLATFCVDRHKRDIQKPNIMTSITVLVVDDYEPVRRFVCSILERRADVQVIGQASDGLEAIQKTAELQPDLILLDIGLPKLNGIETARRVRKLVPQVRILFLSQESSSDVVQEALRSGGLGYVYKLDAQSELLPAIEAVLAGKRFVSSSLMGWESSESTAAPPPHLHEIILCADDTVLLNSFTRFIAAALRAGNPAIVIATTSHLNSLRRALKAEGLDVDGASQQGTYISLDVADMPSDIAANGWPDLVRCFEPAYKAAKAEHPRIAFCGECAGRLWAEGRADAAIRLEQICNELAKTNQMDILCAYPASGVRGEEYQDAFNRICAEHSAVHSR